MGAGSPDRRVVGSLGRGLTGTGCRGYNRIVVYRLKAHEHTEDRLRLGFGVGWRIFFVLIALGFGLTALQPDGVNLFRGLIALIALGAAVYVEEWLFDRIADRVISRTGVIALTTKRELPMSDVSAVVCRTTYPPGLGPAGQVSSPEAGRPEAGRPVGRTEPGSTHSGERRTLGRAGVPPVGTSTGFEFLRRSSGGMLPRVGHRGHVRLWLERSSGERVHVITDSVRSYDWVADLGRTIATFTRTPYREE